MKVSINQMETLYIITSYKVISGNNLNKLWNQLICHAYGKVIRAKGIFHLTPGVTAIL